MLAGATHGITHLEPTVRVPVRGDACGAGDRFAIAAVCALAEGADVLAAATHAVDAASRFVAAGGASAMSRVTELAARDIVGGPDHVPGVASITDDLEGLAARLRRSGGTVVATGGCFDLLHTGHVRLLHRARELGSALVVLLNSDESVRTLKGPSRPVMPAVDRARVLAALGCVDAVCIFDEVSPEAALQRLRPDVWVKGGDYTEEQLPEAAVVRTHGGDVVILPTVPGYSSSNLIAAARS
jgi:rfaE bifunctional protein nucleotidyltransferase chain/domain